MRNKLTKKVIEGVEASGKDVVLWDSEVPGFGLKVTPAGKRVYFAYYRTSSGQQRRPKIGEHGVLTVDEARSIARQWIAEAAAGGDPSKARQMTRETGTVKQLADRYLTEYAAHHKKPRSQATDKANIENHIVPVLGARFVRDVTRADIEALKQAVSGGKTARKLQAKPRGRRIVRGGQGIANRVVALASKMFACAREWGLRDDNPALGIRKFREQRKDRFLDQNEVGRLLKQLEVVDQAGIEPKTVTTAIRVLLFTGMRYGEVMFLRWGDIDEGHGCFRLSDTKTGARTIPYGDMVRNALASLTRGDAKELVFKGRKADAPISLRRPWSRIRAAAGIDITATLHTLRHTFASWSVMGGLSLPQVGALLGHKSAQTTLRYADHAMEAQRAYGDATSKALAAMAVRDEVET
ncbi:tyrosine-type recombinase/integrase [Devosia sp.]|uniref:tyrosine-type recombinase/integrase n=1 Tax=Devosia sp. TaxID=1871048 RepID=UPI003F70A6BD